MRYQGAQKCVLCPGSQGRLVLELGWLLLRPQSYIFCLFLPFPFSELAARPSCPHGEVTFECVLFACLDARANVYKCWWNQDFACRMKNISCHEVLAWRQAPLHLHILPVCWSELSPWCCRRQGAWDRDGEQGPPLLAPWGASSPPLLYSLFIHILQQGAIYLDVPAQQNLIFLTAMIVSPRLLFENRKIHAAKMERFDEYLHAFSALSLLHIIENFRTSPQHLKHRFQFTFISDTTKWIPNSPSIVNSSLFWGKEWRKGSERNPRVVHNNNSQRSKYP